MDNESRHVKIVMTDHGRGEVFLDGRKIEKVVGVRFSAAMGAPNIVHLDLCAEHVEIEGPAVEGMIDG